MKTIIVGAGYAGLNTYYTLNKKAIILSDKDYFLFYTSYLRKLIFNENIKYEAKLNFATLGTVVDYDLDKKWVKTKDGREFQADNLVLAVGCDKSEQISFIRKLTDKEEVSLYADSEEEYLAIQLAFYLKKLGKKVSYCGNLLSQFGRKVEETIKESMSEMGIRIVENCTDELPNCSPPYPFEFFKVDEFLQYKGVYIIGDLIKGFPKVGELAMRTGIYVGNKIKGKTNKPFAPIFINIIDTGRYAIHIRSNKPWGGNIEVVKKSKFRQVMKRFIERYYIFTKGRMGLLYYF